MTVSKTWFPHFGHLPTGCWPVKSTSAVPPSPFRWSGPKEPPVKIDFTGKEPIGKCPKCEGPVFETETAYLCEKSQAEKRPCKFKIGKTILQQPIASEQVVKLLTNGRTDLLKEFISKAGKPFSAYLVLDDMGKVGFEFPPRESESSAEQGH